MFYNVYWLHQAISELHKQERLQIQKKGRDTAHTEEWRSHLKQNKNKNSPLETNFRIIYTVWSQFFSQKYNQKVYS